MEETRYRRLLVGILLVWALLTAAALFVPVHAQRVPRAVQAQRASCTTAWLQMQLGIREKTGHNDGPAVEALIRAGHGQPRDEWCGYTQLAAQRNCGLPFPAEAGGSYNWFRDLRRTYYVRGQRGSADSIRAGHPLGIYSARQGRIAHITRCIAPGRSLRPGRPARGFWCIAGNEGAGTNAGVHLTFYPAVSIYAAANWLY